MYISYGLVIIVLTLKLFSVLNNVEERWMQCSTKEQFAPVDALCSLVQCLSGYMVPAELFTSLSECKLAHQEKQYQKLFAPDYNSFIHSFIHIFIHSFRDVSVRA